MCNNEGRDGKWRNNNNNIAKMKWQIEHSLEDSNSPLEKSKWLLGELLARRGKN
jgi:hypothetical protein